MTRLHELLVVDECWASRLITRLTNPDVEPDMVSASKATVAPKDANNSSPQRDCAGHHWRLYLLFEMNLNVVWRCHAPLDAAFYGHCHNDGRTMLDRYEPRVFDSPSLMSIIEISRQLPAWTGL